MARGGTENGVPRDAAGPDMAAANEGASSIADSSAYGAAAHPTPDPTPQPRQIDFEEVARADVKLVLDGVVLDEVTLVNSSMLPYLAMVASVIEGHTISREKLLQVLRSSMRQRSFDRLPPREYVLGFLNQHPP